MENTPNSKEQPSWTSIQCFFFFVSIYFLAPLLHLRNTEPSASALALKCSPILCLVYFVKVNGLDRWSTNEPYYNYSKHILYGLLSSVLGDALLIWDSLFIYGMIAFIIGHVNYIVAFGFLPLRSVLGVITYGVACGVMILMYKQLSGLYLFAIPFYTTVIATMVWRAVARILVVNFKYQLGTFIGSVLFAFSDTILALNKFVLEFDYAQSVIMSSYYAAQLLISLGVLDPRHPVD